MVSRVVNEGSLAVDHGERIVAYFQSCGNGTQEEIAAHFTSDAVIYDTNIEPMRTAAAIGQGWIRVRDRWQGAQWTMDSLVSDGGVAAIEWSMTGTDPATGKRFTFRGSEHYRFGGEDHLIDEIRQYWTFDPDRLDSALIDFEY